MRAAQQAIQQEEERSLVLNRRMVGGIAQEINARSEVLRIERQLEEARGRLTAIRQAKYKMKGGDTSASDTEPEGYGSGYESFTTRYPIETVIRLYLQGLVRNSLILKIKSNNLFCLNTTTYTVINILVWLHVSVLS